MDNVLTMKLGNVEKLIKNGSLDDAVSILKELAQDYPEQGIIAYYLGRICLIGKDGALALKYFLTAIYRGYATADVYLSTAMLQKNLAAFNDAETNFQKAVEVANTTELIWGSLSCLATFYIESEMYLKADKIAKKIIKEFPENYQGYHLHILIDAMRERYEDAFAYMDMLPEKFKNHPQYLIDVIEIYKRAGMESELSKILEEDNRFAIIIPQVFLREKISAITNDEHDDMKENLIRQLAKGYQDKDAVISIMILEFSRKNFKKSSQIANAILDNEKGNQGFRYYLALYFQIYNLYYLAERKPSVELRKWIEKAGNWCINFVDEMGIPAASDVVTSSIQELFDEINDNDSE